MEMDLISIVEGCQRKEAKAQKCLYDMFAATMLGVCMRYTHSRDEAQDLLHDGFIIAFERIGQLKNPAATRLWLYRIMVNLSINYITRNNALQYVDNDNLERLMENASEKEDAPLDTDSYNIQSVMAALQKLPQNYRLIFNLREIEEMEYADIAEKLGVTESTARSSVTRARQQLRVLLESSNKE